MLKRIVVNFVKHYSYCYNFMHISCYIRIIVQRKSIEGDWLGFKIIAWQYYFVKIANYLNFLPFNIIF